MSHSTRLEMMLRKRGVLSWHTQHPCVDTLREQVSQESCRTFHMRHVARIREWFLTHVNDAKKKGGVELTHFVSRFNKKDYVTHVKESRYTYEWGMWRSHGTLMNEACEGVTVHLWMRHVEYRNESGKNCEKVMSHIMKESRRTHTNRTGNSNFWI